VKIPAGVPHIFANLTEQPIRLIAVFPDARLTWEELGPNPLIEYDTAGRRKSEPTVRAGTGRVGPMEERCTSTSDT
jgi:hypothetical protein